MSFHELKSVSAKSHVSYVFLICKGGAFILILIIRESSMEDIAFKLCLENWQEFSYVRNLRKAFKAKRKTWEQTCINASAMNIDGTEINPGWLKDHCEEVHSKIWKQTNIQKNVPAKCNN